MLSLPDRIYVRPKPIVASDNGRNLMSHILRPTAIPEAEALRLEAHRLAGDIDYILKVRVKNARTYDAFYQALISEVHIFNVTALLSMEEIKSTTVLPV